MYKPVPPTLANVLAFTAAYSKILDARAAPAEEPSMEPTTTAEILSPARDAERAHSRVARLFAALIHDRQALTLVPFVLAREDGAEITPEEAEGVPVDLFTDALGKFWGPSVALTTVALGLPTN